MIHQLETSRRDPDVRPAWIEAFLLASHDAAVDAQPTGRRYRVRPHPGATSTLVRPQGFEPCDDGDD
jgi:hypothetical protein